MKPRIVWQTEKYRAVHVRNDITEIDRYIGKTRPIFFIEMLTRNAFDEEIWTPCGNNEGKEYENETCPLMDITFKLSEKIAVLETPSMKAKND